jgi:signal transduction histidine kinase
MQATQSSTASGSGINREKFAALRHVTREMSRSQPSTPEATTSDTADAPPVVGVAEGAGLAHDAGNLLGALSLYSDLLAMPGVLNEEHREYAAELRMLSERSWALINRLVNHARAGLPSHTQSEISILPDVIDRCLGLLSRITARTIDVSYGLGAFQPVRVPVEAVERILTNLVKNAAEATPWVGAISIHVVGVMEQTPAEDDATGEISRRVVMTVRDRGCGMDQAAVRRLLQASGSTSSDGRGLGFRVVRELVAISGGCLNIESQPNVGTSISAEWHAAQRSEAELRRDETARMKLVTQVLKGEAGWIAY